MREIKFRAWDKINKVMVKIARLDIVDGMAYTHLFNSSPLDFWNDVILEQFTGLRDKNGVEIYEGDVVKFDDEVWSSSYTSCGTEYDSWEVANYGVVGFDEETLRYDFVKYKYNENQVEADLHENHSLEFADFIQEHEVIGNIHEVEEDEI